MKKILLILLLLLAIAGGYMVYKYNESGGFKPPEFVEITDVRFKNLKLPPNMAFTFDSELTLNNPNPFAIDIAGMEFDVFLDDKKATRIVRGDHIEIPPSGEFTMPLSFEIPLNKDDVVSNLLELASGAWKNETINIKAKGKIYFEILSAEIGIPFLYANDYKWRDYLK